MNKKGCSWRSIDVDLKLIQGLDNSPDCFYQNSASVALTKTAFNWQFV